MRVPSLRQHVRGHWFYRVKGRDVYLGFDPAKAVSEYQRAFPPVPVALRPPPALLTPQVAPATAPKTASVSQAIQSLLASIAPEVSPERLKVYGFELAQFERSYGNRQLSDLSAQDLLAFRASLIKKYKPWSVNGRLAVVRRVLRHAQDLELVARLPSLKLLRNVPIGETAPRAMPPALIAQKFRATEQVNPNLARMLRLQWLTCLRPFSIPELVHGRGWFETPNLFVLERSKTEKRTGTKQRVILTDPALQLLKEITPAYDGGRLYRQACQKAGFGAPHPIRHSAAQALSTAGVETSLIEIALGHSIPGAGRFYFQRYEAARRAMIVLDQIVPHASLNAA